MTQVSASMVRQLPEPSLRRSRQHPLRRPWLALALAVSLGAHAVALAALWVELPPQPEAGAVIDVEIATEAGAARASRASAAGSASRAARPAAAPPEKAIAMPAPQRTVSSPADAAPPVAAPPAPAAPVAVEDDSRVAPALKRPAHVPLPPVHTPRLATPAARPAPAARPPRPQPHRETASVPNSDAAAPSAAAPGAGPEPSASPPRYGLGSAANPIPRYPEAARERGWEGLVLLAVSVAADGRAETVSVTRSSGHALLDTAALEAVRRWRFEPARRAGMPVAGTATVPIRFRLDD